MSDIKPEDRDWSAFAGQEIDQTCACRCGTDYRSHAKLFRTEDNQGFDHISRYPCPNCGRHDDIRACYGDPESFTLK